MIRRAASYLAVWAMGALIGSLAVPTFAAFSSSASSSGNRYVTATDWTPPSVTSAVIAKSAGGVPGYIKQGGTYHVYALVSDTGNPASGTSSVTANVSNVTSGSASVAMSSGSFTIGGVTYNYRSAQLTADAGLTHGAKTFSITATDGASNSATVSGYSVSVDNVVPAGTDIQTQNTSGGTNGHAELGDRIVYTYTEQMEPVSILAGWSGSSTNVVVRINNNTINDVVQIWNSSNSTQLALGQINTQGNYVKGDVTFGASGTPSTITQSGATITITLGTVSNTSDINTNSLDTLLWTPSAASTDRAGNPCDVQTVTELGVLDPDF
ncbi:MAG TPA: hypothetical protein VEA19_05565 [Actinomycetota bacterium]|nr:hypothetical protein [Actinomycetota bacterium]